MARLSERLPQNLPGEFYVDRSCIDCDTCRQVAPAVFDQSEIEQSFVHHQPATEEEQRRALMALVACPTASIGTVHRVSAAAGARAFPEPIAGDVHYCGFAAEASFGASSYLIRRPEGNVLVDSPRASRPLLERLTELGGVSLMFLTHRDDVADHRRFRRRFGCDRILHRDDVTAGTADVERQPAGREPISLAGDLLMSPFPATRPEARSSSIRRRSSSPATISGGPTSSAGFPLHGACAGIHGLNKSVRSSACSTSASSGCCPGMAGVTMRLTLKRCAPSSSAWSTGSGSPAERVGREGPGALGSRRTGRPGH